MEIKNETGEDVEVRIVEDRSIGPVRIEEEGRRPETWAERKHRQIARPSERDMESNPLPLEGPQQRQAAALAALSVEGGPTPQPTPQSGPQEGISGEAVKEKPVRNTRGARGLANLPVSREIFEYFLGAATDLRIPVEKVVELVAEDIERLLRGELLATEDGVGQLAGTLALPSLDERVTMEFARRVEERRKQRGGGK